MVREIIWNWDISVETYAYFERVRNSGGMRARTYWNLRSVSGRRTRLTEAELDELDWRVLAILLERFEEHVDDAKDERFLSQLSTDLDPNNETYGRFLTEDRCPP